MKDLSLFPAFLLAILISLPANADPDLVVGKSMSPAVASPTTTDTVDFGFETTHVRFCLQEASAKAYIRLGTTLGATSADVLADTTHNTVIANSSANFIAGVTDVQEERAVPLYVNAEDNQCVTYKWKTRGIVMHVVSGQATMDVTGWRDIDVLRSRK